MISIRADGFIWKLLLVRALVYTQNSALPIQDYGLQTNYSDFFSSNSKATELMQ